jgi:hypothetical protein
MTQLWDTSPEFLLSHIYYNVELEAYLVTAVIPAKLATYSAVIRRDGDDEQALMSKLVGFYGELREGLLDPEDWDTLLNTTVTEMITFAENNHADAFTSLTIPL